MNVKRLTAAYKNDDGKIVRGNAALMHNININGGIKNIVDNVDCIIDGPFKIEQRDITLPMRGSRNQKVYYAPFDLWEKM